MLGLLGVVRPRWPHLPLGRSRQAGLDILGHIFFENLPTQQGPSHTSILSRASRLGFGCGHLHLQAPGASPKLRARHDEEREIMTRHAAYWQPFIDSGQMVIFGPVLDGTGSWGPGVVEADDGTRAM